jgi:hypothetical protein
MYWYIMVCSPWCGNRILLAVWCFLQVLYGLLTHFCMYLAGKRVDKQVSRHLKYSWGETILTLWRDRTTLQGSSPI